MSENIFRERYTIKPLTISMKNPSVKSIAGRASTIISGFSTALTIENTSPATKKPAKPIFTLILLAVPNS